MTHTPEYMKAYIEANKERLIIYRKEYYRAHKEEILARNKAYRDHNREKCIVQKREYYQTNKQEFSLKAKLYREKNRESLSIRKKIYHEANRDKDLARSRRHYEANREFYKQMERNRYQSNKEKHREQGKAWAAANREKVLLSSKKSNHKFRSTPKGNLSSTMSKRINESLRKGMKAGRHWETLVDYTVDQLKAHLEKLFKPGMTWENYGTVWHIDHKTPIAVFNFEHPEDVDFRLCWSLKNLQPLEASKNMSKGARLDKPHQPSLLIKAA